MRKRVHALLPEAIELSEKGHPSLRGRLLIVGSFVASFCLNNFSWHHCHADHCEPTEKPFAHLVLYSDGIHNFIDGLIIAAAFGVSIELGIATTVAIALHGFLRTWGLRRAGSWGFHQDRAAVYNGIAALRSSPVGRRIYSGRLCEWAVPVLLPIAAGFIYIAAADLLPELQCNTRWNPNDSPALPYLSYGSQYHDCDGDDGVMPDRIYE